MALGTWGCPAVSTHCRWTSGVFCGLLHEKLQSFTSSSASHKASRSASVSSVNISGF